MRYENLRRVEAMAHSEDLAMLRMNPKANFSLGGEARLGGSQQR